MFAASGLPAGGALLFILSAADSFESSHAPSDLQGLGQALFGTLAVLLALLVLFVAPALAAGVITSEKERGSYEVLAASPISGSVLIWGKFISVFLLGVLIILLSVPPLATVLLFGGVSPGEMAAAVATITSSLFLVLALGVFWSTALPSSAGATVLSYGTMLGLLIFSAFDALGDFPRAGAFDIVPLAGALNPLTSPWTASRLVCLWPIPIQGWQAATAIHLSLGTMLLAAASIAVSPLKPGPGWFCCAAGAAAWAMWWIVTCGRGLTHVENSDGPVIWWAGASSALALLIMSYPISVPALLFLRENERRLSSRPTSPRWLLLPLLWPILTAAASLFLLLVLTPDQKAKVPPWLLIQLFFIVVLAQILCATIYVLFRFVWKPRPACILSGLFLVLLFLLTSVVDPAVSGAVGPVTAMSETIREWAQAHEAATGTPGPARRLAANLAIPAGTWVSISGMAVVLLILLTVGVAVGRRRKLRPAEWE